MSNEKGFLSMDVCDFK